jgi:hypothetical protein
MIRKRNLLSVSLVVAVMLLTQITVPAQRRGRGGRGGEGGGGDNSGRQGVTYSAAFSVFNNTGVTIYYQVRWGNSAWQNMALGNGRGLTHFYPLDANGRAPIPNVRFDRVADGGRYTEQVYAMQFYAVRSGNYGDNPKPYEFRYSAGGRFLDIYAVG